MFKTPVLWTVAGLWLLAASPLSSFDAFWSDGKAEVSIYGGEVLRYGIRRPQTLNLTVVKEPFDATQGVKASQAGDFEVLKLHAVQSFPTGTYGYQRSWSLFLNEGGTTLKETAVSIDGCGTTFVQAKRSSKDANSLTFTSHSYWQGEADETRSLTSATDSPLLDSLPIWLRLQDLSKPATRKISLLPSLVSSKAPVLTVAPVQLSIGTPESLTVPAGTYQAVPVTILLGEKETRYWFSATKPRVLLKLESPEQWWELKSTTWIDYWNYKKPGDEELLR